MLKNNRDVAFWPAPRTVCVGAWSPTTTSDEASARGAILVADAGEDQAPNPYWPNAEPTSQCKTRICLESKAGAAAKPGPAWKAWRIFE